MLGLVLGAAGCHGTPQLQQSDGLGAVADVDFGRVIVGERASASLVVTDLQGGPFALSGGDTLSGNDPGDFQVLSAPGGTVPDHGSISGEVDFAPSAPGGRQARSPCRPAATARRS